MIRRFRFTVKIMIEGITTFLGYKMRVAAISEFNGISDPVYFNDIYATRRRGIQWEAGRLNL